MRPPPLALPGWMARLQPRERRLALGAGIVMVSWAMVSWLLQPLWNQADALRGEVESQTEKLDALSQLLAQRPAVTQAYDRIAAYVQPPDGGAQAMLLTELESLSRQSDVRLNLKPRPAQRDAHTERLEIEVDIEGSQASVLGFLDNVLKMPRLVSVDRLRVSSVPARANLVRANVVLQHITLR